MRPLVQECRFAPRGAPRSARERPQDTHPTCRDAALVLRASLHFLRLGGKPLPALSSYLPSHYLSPIVLLLNSFFSKALKPDNLICPTKTANRWWLLPNIFSAKEFLETILVSSCSIPTVKRLSLLLWSEEEGSPCREL